jgi:hypothetical protein
MYIESIDSFMQQAEALYRANPLRTRYVVKYRHCDGKLWLKVTDNATVCPTAHDVYTSFRLYGVALLRCL